MAVELEANREMGSCSNGSNLHQFWKRLWSLQIPHKIRHFAWGGARDILPTKANLVCRNVLGDRTCEECGGALESLLHLFWECTKAKETWSLSSLFPLLSMTHFSSFFDFLWHILMDAQWGTEKSGLAVTIVWALWTNRNEVRHGKQRKAGMSLLSWCKNYLDEYWNVSCLSPKVFAQQASHHLEANWSPPNYPLYKINVDGAVFSSQKAAGIGVIVRDYEGNFIAGLSKKIHAPLGAIEVEAEALEIGMALENLYWKGILP